MLLFVPVITIMFIFTDYEKFGNEIFIAASAALYNLACGTS